MFYLGTFFVSTYPPIPEVFFYKLGNREYHFHREVPVMSIILAFILMYALLISCEKHSASRLARFIHNRDFIIIIVCSTALE